MNRNWIKTPEQLHQEFLNQIVFTPTGCWEWTGSKNHGYGFFAFEKRKNTKGGQGRAHRYSYMFYKGPIPDGLTIDHLCRNKCCVNPNHLEAVTLKENVLRSEGISAINARKFCCIRGHALVGKNLVPQKTANGIIRGRQCRKCKQMTNRR